MFSSMTAKRKKVILLILIVLCVSAILVFTALSQKRASTVNGNTIIMSNEGTRGTSLDKELAQRVQLQERLQASINALDEVETSAVTITPSDKDTAPTAAIIIKLAEGKTLTTEQQAEIKKLLHASISNISDENITLSIS